jgi:hypothetical protein
MAVLVVTFVLIQSVVFLVRAWKRGLEIGLTKNKMKQAIRTSAVLSIVPTIPILLALVAMVPVLGLPFPWIRLSIIGAAPYELVAADMGAKSMGLAGLGAEGYTAEAFANSMWVMSIGIIWGILFCIFGLKSYTKKIKNMKEKDSTWGAILIMALFFGMLSSFVAPYFGNLAVGANGSAAWIPVLTLVSSGLIMGLLTWTVNKFKIDWLSNFSMSISMIAGMALAILYTGIL